MKNRRVHIVLIMATLAVAVLAASAAFTSRGQAPRSKSKRTVNVTDHPHPAETNSSTAFAAAAAQNATLRNELSWTFGGKQQRGWYLYDLLIGKTLNSQHDAVSSDFAASLSKWQKKAGLSSNGILDEQSLMSMISQWQRNRLKNRTPATPDQLVLVPASDFYDPGRAAELRQVERNTYEAYKQMVAAALADPELKLSSKDQYFKIISAFRSHEYQDQLRKSRLMQAALDSQ